MFASIAEAYDAALRGDLDALAPHAGRLAEDASTSARVWRALVAGLRWFAAPSPSGAPVDLTALAALGVVEGEVADLAARAAAHEVRAAALAMDAARLRRAVDAVRRWAERGGTEARAWASVGTGWLGVLDGIERTEALEAAGRDALRVGRAELVLEAASVRALSAASIDEALAHGRRASRMARTEALPHSEYLANLALARSRRLAGKPHLATHILVALLRVAPAPWAPWLRWELALSDGQIEAGGSGPAALLAAVLEAAHRGEPAVFRAAWSALVDGVRQVAPLARDVAAIEALLDPSADLSAAPAPITAWARGEGAMAPFGLFGLDGGAAAFVAAPRTGHGRRYLGRATGLVRASLNADVLGAEQGGQLRTDSAVAALLLAHPDGMTEDALFRLLYGFAYEPNRHQAVRDTLYNRVRKRIQPAKLERHLGRAQLVLERALLVPDPRAAPPPELSILRVLAERHGAAAKDVAEELDIPLRTAQDALKRLAEDGAVKKERVSLGLTYALEDTTFSEPTTQRPGAGR